MFGEYDDLGLGKIGSELLLLAFLPLAPTACRAIMLGPCNLVQNVKILLDHVGDLAGHAPLGRAEHVQAAVRFQDSPPFLAKLTNPRQEPGRLVPLAIPRQILDLVIWRIGRNQVDAAIGHRCHKIQTIGMVYGHRPGLPERRQPDPHLVA